VSTEKVAGTRNRTSNGTSNNTRNGTSNGTSKGTKVWTRFEPEFQILGRHKDQSSCIQKSATSLWQSSL